MAERLFSGGSRAALLVIATIGVVATVLLLVVEDDGNFLSADADSYSSSGIGHKALVSLLREQGIPVVINRDYLAREVAPGDLLLVLEPRIRFGESKQLSLLLEGKRRVLLSLPKWVGVPSMSNPNWIFEARPISPKSVQGAANLLLEEPRLVRLPKDSEWREEIAFDPKPSIEAPQLLSGTGMDGLIKVKRGVLVGTLTGGKEPFDEIESLVLISDPDLFNNHGLHRGGNARVMLDLIEWLLPEGGTLYVDESLHGFAEQRSIADFILRPPYLGVVLIALMALGLVIWTLLVPFGTPLEGDAPISANQQPTTSGHLTLIENSARLLVAGGHDRYLVERYQASILEEISLRLGIPSSGTGRAEMGALRHQLNQHSQRRGVDSRLPDITLEKGNLLPAALRCYQWMRGMLRGL